MKRSKGITLIALVLTIIVLLILAGISIAMITADNGILKKATTAKENTITAQYEEELNLVIAGMRTDAIYKNEKFDMPYIIEKLPEYLNVDGKKDYTWDIEDKSVEEPEGEYKEYIFYIDKNYQAHIDGKATGIKPDIKVQVLTEEYIVEGENAEIQIQVTAEIAEGSVTIIAPNEIALASTTTDTELKKVYIYTTNKNGNYTFTAQGITETGEKGRKARDTVNVNKIIDKPKINISNNTGIEAIVNIENEYPEEANVIYTYYLDEVAKATNIREKSYKMENLNYNTEYTVKVVIQYNMQPLESENVKFITAQRVKMPKIKPIYDYNETVRTTLEYPILTLNGMMNCKVKPEIGAKIRLEISNESTEGVENYYSLDGGINWKPYNNVIDTTYQGEGLIQAKSINKYNNSQSSINVLKNYVYEPGVECSKADALKSLAFNGEDDSHDVVDEAIGWTEKFFMIDPDCRGHYITFKYRQNSWIAGLEFRDGSKSTIQRVRIDDTKIWTKSVIIPSGTVYGTFSTGTKTGGVYIEVYNVWCSEENLTEK